MDRILEKVEIDPETGCHNWTAGLNRGYGRISKGGQGQGQVSVHRVTYEAAKGPIPEGFQVDHLCKNPRCCNPDHLEAVTPQENNRRSDSPSAKRLRQTHCKRGHALEGDNLILDGTWRNCRACAVDRKRAYYNRWHRRPAPEINIAALARQHGMHFQTVHKRLKRGLSLEEALRAGRLPWGYRDGKPGG